MSGRAESTDIDAVLLLSFGGPEGPDQVMPFLENVTRGRGIPRERLASVAELLSPAALAHQWICSTSAGSAASNAPPNRSA